MDVSVYESIRSEGVCPGAVVVSAAGHDTGRTYLVLAVKERFAFLADGRTRKADNPKKKRVTHLKVLGITKETQILTDEIALRAKNETRNIMIRDLITGFLDNAGTINDEKENEVVNV